MSWRISEVIYKYMLMVKRSREDDYKVKVYFSTTSNSTLLPEVTIINNVRPSFFHAFTYTI